MKALLFILLSCSAAFSAEEGSHLRNLQRGLQLKEPAKGELPPFLMQHWTVPNLTFGAPSAFGADWGIIYGGLAIIPYNKDLVPYFGFGLGNSIKYVGLTTQITIYDVASEKRITFAEGGVSLKLHRFFPRIGLGIAVGMENIYDWGPVQSPKTRFAVVSKYFKLRDSFWFSGLAATLGIGDGRFKKATDLQSGEESINVFGSLGLRIALPLSLVIDWTGRDLNIGSALAPFRTFPLILMLGVGNVLENHAHLSTDRYGRHFIFALSVAISFI